MDNTRIEYAGLGKIELLPKDYSSANEKINEIISKVNILIQLKQDEVRQYNLTQGG